MHNLFKQVDEVGVGDPLVAAEIEALLQDGYQGSQALPKQLVLLVHDLGVVAARHTEQSHVYTTVSI